MASLPDEIIFEILSRLPVKSLLRFTIVSKSWKSLIHNPNFIKLHLNQTLASNSDNHLIIFHKSMCITDLNLDNTHNPLSFSELHHPLKSQPVLIHGSCNGILCISDKNYNNVLLYNPLTNCHCRVPLNYFFDDPVNNYAIYGFGYDSVTDDYKVLNFFQKFNHHTCEIIHSEAQVLSLKTNSWKSFELISHSDNFRNYQGVYLNDAGYYPVLYNKIFLSIVKFNFRTDSMSRIECPNLGNTAWMTDLGAYKRCLCMFVNYIWNCDVPHADFWVMKESWVRLFNIRDLTSYGILCTISIIASSSDGRKILVEDRQMSSYAWYDLEDGTFERIDIIGQPGEQRFNACCTLGSLVSLVD